MELYNKINNEALDEDLNTYKNVVNMSKKQVKTFGQEDLTSKLSGNIEFQQNLKAYIDNVSRLIIFKINKFINTDADKERYLNLEDIVLAYNNLAGFLTNYVNTTIVSSNDDSFKNQEMTKLYILVDRLYNMVEPTKIRNKKELGMIKSKLQNQDYSPLQFIEYYKDHIVKKNSDPDEDEDVSYPKSQDLDKDILSKQKKNLENELLISLNKNRKDSINLSKHQYFFNSLDDQTVYNKLENIMDTYQNQLIRNINLDDFYIKNIKNIGKKKAGIEVVNKFNIKYDFTNEKMFKDTYDKNKTRLDNASPGDIDRFNELLSKLQDKYI